jgi:uncharacterized membrane protein YebE (DUF533 family)
MKSLRILVLAATFAAISAVAASAHTATARIDRREAMQHHRIVQGMKRGQLTRAEARRLRAGQRHVHRMERLAKADGHVTARERARIARAQNVQSRHIRRFKHNQRTRTY